MAARRDYLGGWEYVEKGADGRAIAGTLTSTDGTSFRVIGTYGVSGACLPGFENMPERLGAENRLKTFMAGQVQKAAEFGWVVVVVGA